MNSPRIILDSGAYTAWKQGKPIDIDEYAEFFLKNKEVFDSCFNLDVILDAKGSYENWVYLKKHGVESIPVYHIGTDEKWLKRILKQTDHIGLGAVANLSSVQRRHGLDHIFSKYLTDETGAPTVKVHGLGITAMDLILQYPWYSIDSFTPVLSASFGSIYLPRVKNDGSIDYFEGDLCKVSNQAKYEGKSENSFVSFLNKKKIKDTYLALFEKYGFKLGDITDFEKNQTRKDKRAGKTLQLKSMLPPTKTTNDEITLANNWLERLRWTLVMWNELKKELPEPRGINKNKCIIYSGASTPNIMRVMDTVLPKHDILVSFAYMNETFFNSFKAYKDGTGIKESTKASKK